MTYLQTQYDPFTTVGFDRIFDRITSLHNEGKVKGSNSYPPYNITKESDTTYIVELAVAGFTEETIDIEVADGELTIQGNAPDSPDEKEYLHRGIAARAFSRKFTLAETVVVRDASLENGMLRILLENVIPEEQNRRRFLSAKLLRIPKNYSLSNTGWDGVKAPSFNLTANYRSRKS